MKEVPNIISSKDLSYIKDMLSWNFVMAKKCNHYLKLVKDKEELELIKIIYELHKEHYKELADILS